MNDRIPDLIFCVYPGCDALVFEDEGRLCDTHYVDEYGVRYSDCECYQSSADNADMYVCGLHRKAWEVTNDE